MNVINKNILAECVGLWLAEGDTKSKLEITLTNNSFDIILFFHQNMMKIYEGKNKPRIYVYSPSNRKLFDSFSDTKIRFYQDKRANRPYYIFRLADAKFVRKWHGIVEKIKKDEKFHKDILRGIFAGEGNIKFDEVQETKTVRIAQGKRDAFLEKIFHELGLEFAYDTSNRMYWFGGKKNLNLFDRFKITSLHPEKEAKFQRMIKSYNNVSKLYLKNKIYRLLKEPKKSKELANLLNISWKEAYNILKKLKDLGKIDYLKENGETYWARKLIIKRVLFIRKFEILSKLNRPKIINELARETGIYRKTVSKRLKKMKKLGLVKNINRKWIITKEGKNFVYSRHR